MAKKMTLEKATELMTQGFHCSQSVMHHTAEDLGMLDKDLALKISGGLGGGCWSGNVCGTVSAALLSLSLAYGYSEPDLEQDEILKAKSMEFIQRFKERNGNITCEGLLGINVFTATPEELAARGDVGLGDCPKYVTDACEILDAILNEK